MHFYFVDLGVLEKLHVLEYLQKKLINMTPRILLKIIHLTFLNWTLHLIIQ